MFLLAYSFSMIYSTKGDIKTKVRKKAQVDERIGDT